MRTATFHLYAIPKLEAARPNLIHCSLFQQDRLGWWSQPTASNAISYGVMSGQYGINGYNVYQMHAKPGSYIDLSQPIGLSDPDNTDKAGFALADNEWYTLSFTCRGVHRHVNEDGSYTDLSKPTLLYVYVYPSVIDTAEKIIVDGEQRSAPGDMRTAIPVTWDIEEHTITFKTKALSTQPKVLFRAFGEGTTAYDSVTFADGGCFARIAKVKVEQGKTATPYTPHYTESMPSVHAVAFKRTNTDISSTRPTGGTYYSPTPSGWDDGIPSGIMRLWETKAVFVPELPSTTWGLPSPVGDTMDMDVEFSPYDGTPTSNVSNNLAPAGTAATATTDMWFDISRNSDADFSKMIWRAERTQKNGVWGTWTIVKVKGEKGEDSVVLDLDNEMDSVAVNSSGITTSAVNITIHATLYKGASPVTGGITPPDPESIQLNGVTPMVNTNGGVVTITYSYSRYKKFENKNYTVDIPVIYGGVTYTATFTLVPVFAGADGEAAVIYNVKPSMTSCSFSRTSSNGITPSSYKLQCGYTRTVGGTTEAVDNATKDFEGNWHIFYRRHVGLTIIDDWTKYTGDVSATSTYSAYEFCIAKTNNEEVLNGVEGDKLIVDRETVPVVVGGKNGSDGDSPVIYSIRLLKQVCSVDSNDICHVDIQWQVIRTVGSVETIVNSPNTQDVSYHQHKYSNSDVWLSNDSTTNINKITLGNGRKYSEIGSPQAIELRYRDDGTDSGLKATASVPFNVSGKDGISSDPASVFIVDTDIKAIPCYDNGVVKTGVSVTVSAFERDADGTMSAISPLYIIVRYMHTPNVIGGEAKSIIYSGKGSNGSRKVDIPSTIDDVEVTVNYVDIYVYKSENALSGLIKHLTLYPLCDGQQGVQGPTGPEGKPIPSMLVSTPTLGFTLAQEEYGSVVGDASVRLTALYGESSKNTIYEVWDNFQPASTSGEHWRKISSNSVPVGVCTNSFITSKYYWRFSCRVDNDTLVITPESVDSKAINGDYNCVLRIRAKHPSYSEYITTDYCFYVVRRGQKGEARSYTPYLMGVYNENTEYVWNDSRRDFVYYPVTVNNQKIYHIWGVKEYGMKFFNKTPGEKYPNDTYNEYWEQGDVYKLLVTNCIFGDNAILAGMKFTAEKMVSTSPKDKENEEDKNIIIDGSLGKIKGNDCDIRGKIVATSGELDNVVIKKSCTIDNADGWSLKANGSDQGCMLVGASTSKDVTLTLQSSENSLSMTNAASNNNGTSVNATPMIRAKCYNGLQIDASKNAIQVLNGNVLLGGNQRLNVRTISSNGNIRITDDVVVFTNSGSITVGLPSTSDAHQGKVLYIKKIGGGSLTLVGNIIRANSTGVVTQTNSFGSASMMYICANDYWIEYYCG